MVRALEEHGEVSERPKGEGKRFRSVSFECSPNDNELCSLAGDAWKVCMSKGIEGSKAA